MLMLIKEISNDIDIITLFDFSVPVFNQCIFHFLHTLKRARSHRDDVVMSKMKVSDIVIHSSIIAWSELKIEKFYGLKYNRKDFVGGCL